MSELGSEYSRKDSATEIGQLERRAEILGSVGDWQGLNNLVLTDIQIFLSSGHPKTLQKWLEFELLSGVVINDEINWVGQVTEGLEAARIAGLNDVEATLNTLAAYGQLSRGKISEAAIHLSNMAALLSVSNSPESCRYHFLSAWQALLANEYTIAIEHGYHGLNGAVENGERFSAALNHVLIAQALFECDEQDEAEEHLSAAEEIAYSINNQLLKYAHLCTEAYFAFRIDKKKLGCWALRQAMMLGKRHGIVSCAGWRPDMMADLCVRALENNIQPDYVRQLITEQQLIPVRPPLHLENWPWPIKIYTLGRFSLLKNGSPVKSCGKGQKRPLEMLKVLIAFGGRDVSETRLAEALWPDADGDAAHQALRTTLHRLRKLLCHEAIDYQQGQVSLDARYCWVDSWELERILGECLAVQTEKSSNNAQFLMNKIIHLYQGPFLGDKVDQPWALYRRERLNSKVLNTLHKLAVYFCKEGNCVQAIEIYKKGIEVDVLAEEFYRGLMNCYAAEGEFSQAVRTYKKCCLALKAGLEVNPATPTKLLYRSIRDAEENNIEFICRYQR